MIKGIRFEGVRVIGEPNEIAKQYAADGADELLYIDAVASLYGRNSISNILKIASNEIYIPITASGGIRSIADAANLIQSGADKIAINTAALKNPQLIRDLVKTFGSQCIVISIQARKKSGEMNWEAMTEMGREKSGKNVLNWIEQVQELGAGEILLTSIDQDGTLSNPDFELIQLASKVTKIPLIISGGLTKTSDISNVLKKELVSGIALGGSLHYKKQSINLLKKKLYLQKLNIRNEDNLSKYSRVEKPLNDIKIGIVDYEMGNQQSLFNTLKYLGANVFISKDRDKLERSNLLALPGVGAFPKGIANLKKLKLDDFIKEKSIEGLPIFGICLGMQMLFQNSTEFANTEGLNIVDGNVKIINNKKIKLPHMGWNKIISTNNSKYTLSNIYQYFVHSYAAYNVHPNEIIYRCNYEKENFIVGIKKENIVGLQFHPERSGISGINLIKEIIVDLLN